MWAELERAIQAGAVIAYGAGLSDAWAAWLASQLVPPAAQPRDKKEEREALGLESDVSSTGGDS